MELLEANDRFYCKHLTCPSLASPICINYTLKPQKTTEKRADILNKC